MADDDTVLCVTSYYDVVSREMVHHIGLKDYTSGFKDSVRPHLLILNGMLLRVEARMVEPGPPRPPTPARQKRLKKLLRDPRFPDFSGMYCDICACYDLVRARIYTTGELTNYLVRFTNAVIPLLKLSGSESEKYIRENLGRVIDYLVLRLKKKRLRFYKLRYGKSPEENGILVFGDFSNPAQPFIQYPVFGLKNITPFRGPRNYIRWTPCPNESQEPEEQPRIKWTAEREAAARARPTREALADLLSWTALPPQTMRANPSDDEG